MLRPAVVRSFKTRLIGALGESWPKCEHLNGEIANLDGMVLVCCDDCKLFTVMHPEQAKQYAAVSIFGNASA